MHLDPIMPLLTATALVIIMLGILMHRFKLPYAVIYIIAGILIGPSGLSIVTDDILLSRMGSIGVLLLLFFVGMEISLDRLIANWRIAILGTTLQILLSVVIALVIGSLLAWPFARSILIGFVISLSSTAVVIKMLQEWGEMNSEVGRDVISILLVQDLAIVPMIIITGFLGKAAISVTEMTTQIVGGVMFIMFVTWILKKGSFVLPFGKILRRDHELQVFAAFLLCFGFALVTSFFYLSTALGAFLAGIVLSASKETSWVHQKLEPFYVVFVAVFFVSIGALIDITFVKQNIMIILILVFFAVLTNNLVNTLILRGLRVTWKSSIYGGALLSQIGEFSFMLALLGYQADIINEYVYQLTVAVIGITLLLTPFWIIMARRLILKEKGNVQHA